MTDFQQPPPPQQPPYSYPGAPGYPMPEPPSVRSAVPKVIGILMIIFGGFALFGGLFGLLGRGEIGRQFGDIMSTFSTLTLMSNLVSLGLGALQLITGIKLLGYKDTAPKLAITWGAIKIVRTLICAFLSWFWLRPKFAAMGGYGEAMIGMTVILSAFFSIGWSVTVVALVAQPYPRASCTNY
ncbi:MAG: hypothetical protein NT062_03035 [Proteobacteria bacterium]|nr:hypothetical protein [Pseudomonadota bacterium]